MKLHNKPSLSSSHFKQVIISKPNLFLNDPNKVVDQNQETGFRMYKIIVAPNALTPGSEYSFTLAVVDACGTSQSILPLIRMNSPPSGGSMAVTGIEGTDPPAGWSLTSASATMFALTAPGWSDPEATPGIDSALTYTFVYLSDPSDETSKKVRLFTGTDISSYSTNLPVGSGENGLFKLAVLIEDEDGGKTTSSWLSIYVTSEPLPEDAAAQEAIFDDLLSNNLEAAQNKSQSGEVLAAANMVSTALSSGNVDEAVKTKIAARLVDMALKAAETMAVDAASVDMQAQFVGTIATSSELDSATTNKVLSMTEDLAAASESNGAMSEDTQNALADTLTAFMLSSNAAATTTTNGDGGGDGDGTDTGESSSGDDGTTTTTGGGSSTAVVEPKVDVAKVQRLQAAVTSVMSAVSTGLVPGAKPIAIATAAFTATLESARPSAMVEKPIVSSTGLKIDISADTFGNVTSGADVQSLVVEFKNQPSLDNGATAMGADGVRIVFKTGGDELKVRNLTEPNVIKVPLKIDPLLFVKNETLPNQQPKTTSTTNSTVITIDCAFVGQNHTIANCSDTLPDFNYTCIQQKNQFEFRCPEIAVHPECVYWNKNTSSWAQDGLITIVNNVTGEVTCTSDHLTDFSVKVESSFGAVDDILASPFDEKVSNPEELMALLYKNVVVIVTMIITFSFFVFSCGISRYYDKLDEYTIKKKRKKIHHIKNVWSASRGIVSWKQLEQNINTTAFYKLWWEGIKAYHPLLSIYFTHSMAMSRPQRVMILMVMITTNMFVDAMFWNVRYPDAESKPALSDIILFGMIAAALNVPVITVFEEAYKRVGAAVVAREKILMLGKHILKSDADAAAERLSRNVRTVEDAELHLQVVQGAVLHTGETLENQKTRHVMMKAGTAMHKMSALEVQEHSQNYNDMKAQCKRAEQILSAKLKQAKEADDRWLELKRLEHEYDLYGGTTSKKNKSNATAKSFTALPVVVKKTTPFDDMDEGVGDMGTKKSTKNDRNILQFSAPLSSPQEKKNKIPLKSKTGSSVYVVAVDQKGQPAAELAPEQQKREKRCCAALRLKFRMYQERNNLIESKRIDKMSPNEKLIETKVKKKNFIVQQLFAKNKDGRDPGFELPPAPWWAQLLLDCLSFALVLFFCYFIVAFGFFYGQAVAISW